MKALFLFKTEHITCGDVSPNELETFGFKSSLFYCYKDQHSTFYKGKWYK